MMQVERYNHKKNNERVKFNRRPSKIKFLLDSNENHYKDEEENETEELSSVRRTSGIISCNTLKSDIQNPVQEEENLESIQMDEFGFLLSFETIKFYKNYFPSKNANQIYKPKSNKIRKK